MPVVIPYIRAAFAESVLLVPAVCSHFPRSPLSDHSYSCCGHPHEPVRAALRKLCGCYLHRANGNTASVHAVNAIVVITSIVYLWTQGSQQNSQCGKRTSTCLRHVEPNCVPQLWPLCVYTRLLTRVQLTSGREASYHPPMDVG